MLAKAGVEVVTDVCDTEALHLNEGFFLKVLHNRPLVTLKIASSADGRTATRSGQSQWITGEPARARGQLLRATHDAIMVGSATAIVDDPSLTCRLPGLQARTPIRIVADGRLRLPLTAKLVREAKQSPVWILTLPNGDASRRAAFKDCGVELIDVAAGAGGFMDMKLAMALIAERGVTRLLVEGGSRLAASMLRDELVGRVEWFSAGCVIGGDGMPAVAGLGIDALADMPVLHLKSASVVGGDVHASYLTSYRAN
jgi:diaminohydroxyphosphoribosylaminopyrimidine deaminase/5-amino-6-(5-phosphoribosylamino)uracil reductase